MVCLKCRLSFNYKTHKFETYFDRPQSVKMSNVQLIVFAIGNDCHMYAELLNGKLYSGVDRVIYGDDLSYATAENTIHADTMAKWKAYAEGRIFPIHGSTADARFEVARVTGICLMRNGFVMPLFQGLMHCPSITFPKMLWKPVVPPPQPPIVGVAPAPPPPRKTEQEIWMEQRELEESRTPAQKRYDEEISLEAMGQAPPKRRGGWFG